MSQISAVFSKTFKVHYRSRAIWLGSIAWPNLLLLLFSSTALSGVPTQYMYLAYGMVTLMMMVFALMISGIGQLASSIARDREIGLLVKLKSMPVSPTRDIIGRILAYLSFGLVSASVTLAVGLAIGARFNLTLTSVLESTGFLLMALLAAVSIGLILGSLLNSVQGTMFLGLATTLASGFLGGIFVSYSNLPSALQVFSRFYPISSGMSSAAYVLLGQDVTGYNPLATSQIIAGIITTIVLLAIGITVYHRFSWRRNS